MYFVRQISSGAKSLFNRGLTPFRNMRNSASKMRSDNPLTNYRHQLRAYQGKLNYYRSLPKRYLGISFGSDTDAAAADDEKAKDSADYDPSTLYELGNRPEKLQERMRLSRSKKATTKQVEHLQIHLRDPHAPSHDIVHIGRLTGHLEANYNLNGVQMRFSQVMEKDVLSDSNVMLRTRSSEVLVNGQPVVDQAIVPKNSVINVKGRRYHVDLQPDYGYIDKPAYVGASWSTHVGPRRENEDAIGIYESDDMRCFVVADGVGNGYNGNQISEFAAKYILSAVDMNYGRRVDWSVVLEDAITNANIEVRNFTKKLSRRSPQRIRAGTTLTTIHIKDWMATIGHVGDSRLYLLRDESLTQITTNHTEYMPADDPNTPDVIEIESTLSRAIGKADTISPEILRLHLEPNDRFLLCSDGINKQLTDSDLADYLRSNSLAQVAEELVNEANKRLTDDNSSVVVIDVRREPMQDIKGNQAEQDRVFVSTHKRAIRYERLQRIKTESVKRSSDDGDNNETRGGIALGCTVLIALIAALFFVSIWGGGLWQSFQDSLDFAQENTVTEVDAQAIVTESTATPEPDATSAEEETVIEATSTSAFVVSTATSTEAQIRSLPTRGLATIESVTATAQVTADAATQAIESATATDDPNAIAIEIISPTPLSQQEATSTPRATQAR